MFLSHTFTVSSLEALASSRPSGENVTEVTCPVWAPRARNSFSISRAMACSASRSRVSSPELDCGIRCNATELSSP